MSHLQWTDNVDVECWGISGPLRTVRTVHIVSTRLSVGLVCCTILFHVQETSFHEVRPLDIVAALYKFYLLTRRYNYNCVNQSLSTMTIQSLYGSRKTPSLFEDYETDPLLTSQTTNDFFTISFENDQSQDCRICRRASLYFFMHIIIIIDSNHLHIIQAIRRIVAPNWEKSEWRVPLWFKLLS